MRLYYFGIILLLVILGEFIETLEAYKSIRPWKFYRPRPRAHKPRWHPYSRPPRYSKFKKGPPKRPHYYHGYNDVWQKPGYAVDHSGEDQPYTIEIELPKRYGSSAWENDPPHHRNYDAGTVQDFYGDEDYIEENEEQLEERIMQPGRKRVGLKVIRSTKPKLRIKISRDDDLTEIADSTSRTFAELNPRKKSSSSMSLVELGQSVDESDWVPENPVPSFPKTLRGA